MNTQELSDRIALKEVVDLFSNYADTKDNDAQVALFTQDAEVNIVIDGKQLMSMHGRDEIAKAFGGSMTQYSAVFHMNGQQTVNIDGDTASGTAYSFVTLVEQNDDGNKTTSHQGVRYTDEYRKVEGQWLISKRTSNFIWRDDLVG